MKYVSFAIESRFLVNLTNEVYLLTRSFAVVGCSNDVTGIQRNCTWLTRISMNELEAVKNYLLTQWILVEDITAEAATKNEPRLAVPKVAVGDDHKHPHPN